MSSASAQQCAVTESRAALATLSGARIASVDVVAEGPELPGLTEVARPLHPVSRDATLRRQLLFAPGDTVDTLLVGETLRRLRRQRLFSDVLLQAKQCGDSAGVALTLRSRDSWTLRPTARLRTPSTLALGMEERNFLGTGRSVALNSEMTTRGSGAAFTLSDPWLFGTDVAGNVRIASLAGTHTVRAGVRNHEYSVFDRWRLEAGFSRVTHGDTTTSDRTLHTLGAAVSVGRRVGSAPYSVTLITVGAEFDSAAAVSSSRRVADPSVVHARSFLGGDLGFVRRTAVFDTASWMVPGRGFLDIPLGWETEVVVGAGWQREAHVPALHPDAWIGRVWLPSRGQIVMVDAWSSGYIGRGLDANHIERLSAGWYHAAARGMWAARVSAERQLEVDPDLRFLSIMPAVDYTTPVLRSATGLWGRSVAISAERTVHIAPVGAASVLDVGPFVAGSYHWQMNDMPGSQVRAGVLGGRLRVLSANGAVSSVRVDVGYPVILSESLVRRPFAAVVFGTLFDVSRQRDGKRL